MAPEMTVRQRAVLGFLFDGGALDRLIPGSPVFQLLTARGDPIDLLEFSEVVALYDAEWVMTDLFGDEFEFGCAGFRAMAQTGRARWIISRKGASDYEAWHVANGVELDPCPVPFIPGATT